MRRKAARCSSRRRGQRALHRMQHQDHPIVVASTLDVGVGAPSGISCPTLRREVRHKRQCVPQGTARYRQWAHFHPQKSLSGGSFREAWPSPHLMLDVSGGEQDAPNLCYSRDGRYYGRGHRCQHDGDQFQFYPKWRGCAWTWLHRRHEDDEGCQGSSQRKLSRELAMPGLSEGAKSEGANFKGANSIAA